MINDNAYISLNKIRWAARRGMLELDLMLSPYVENCYIKSSKDDQKIFILLLKQEDPDLFSWLLKSEPCPEIFQEIISKIFSSKRSQSYSL